jgi:hypothetical protein
MASAVRSEMPRAPPSQRATLIGCTFSLAASSRCVSRKLARARFIASGAIVIVVDARRARTIISANSRRSEADILSHRRFAIFDMAAERSSLPTSRHRARPPA